VINVILPSRNRPQACREAVDSLLATRGLGDTRVTVVADSASSTIQAYRDLFTDVGFIETTGNMIERTNYAAKRIDGDIIGWMADDNRFRTQEWDRIIDDEFEYDAGFVALDDLFWSQKGKPANIFTKKSVIAALGWYANPGQHHFYMEDTLRVLAVATDNWTYLEGVVCEHLHPAIGKGEWDDAYRQQETQAMYDSEGRAFIDWIQTRFEGDRERVLGALR